jgi:poly-gamma-glutamate synthesis protein (capsule biosynthesis protein)
VDIGADAVVNHHQHCYSGYELYKNSPIVYGLGNFCFDKADSEQSKWQEGYMVELDFRNEGVGLKCIPFIQCRDNCSVKILSSAQSKIFFERLNNLNVVIQDDFVLEQKYDSFMANEKSNKKLCLAPYDSKLFKYACKKGILPSFISRKRKLFVLAHVQCESLRDVFLYYLKH